MEQVAGAPPEVVIMDCRADADGKLALAQVLIEAYPAVGVLLVSDRASELALPAMRAGVHDILSPESSVEEFGLVVDTIAEATLARLAQFSEIAPEQVVVAAPTGKVISVMSPKGGVGKTTVATNVAVGLAKHAP